MRRAWLWSLFAVVLAVFLLPLCHGESAAVEITEIEERAFYEDVSLTEIELSASLRSIGAEAFAKCTGLTMFKCKSKNVVLGENVFAGDEGIQFFCYLNSSLDVYARQNGIPCQYYDACRIECDTVNNGCAGLPIQWTITDVMPGESVVSTFSYNIYNGSELVQSLGASANRVVSFTPKAAGEYRLEVTVLNSITTTTLSSDPVPAAAKLYFGTYEQDGNSETKDPLEWRILSVSGNKAFIITEKIIHNGSYFNPYWIKYKYTYWSGSYIGTASSVNYRGSAPESDATRITGISPTSIPLEDGSRGKESDLFSRHARYWCNSVFYPKSFTDEEKARILKTHNKNPDNPTYGVDGGPDTDDYAFFLSYDEMNAYMPGKSDRICSLTKAAKAEIGSKPAYWWLRTPGKFRVNAIYVYGANGSVSVYGSDVGHSNLGYRPAMWITIGG